MEKETEKHLRELADPTQDIRAQVRAAEEAKDRLLRNYPYSKKQRFLNRINFLKGIYDPYYCTKIYSRLTYHRIALVSHEGKYILGDWELPSWISTSMLVPLTKTHIFHGAELYKRDVPELLVVPLFYSDARVGYVLCFNPFAPLDEYDIAIVEYMGIRYTETVCFEAAKENRQLLHIQRAIESLSKTERSGLITLAKKAEGLPTLRFSQSQMAKETNITRTTIVALLQKLVSGGIIEAQTHGKAGSDITFTNWSLLMKALKPYLDEYEYTYNL